MTAKPEISAMASFLYERIKHNDSYLVFLGETSSGKSSLINGLLGADILPMKASPTTAAITEVELSTQTADEAYYAINKNATIERIDRNMFVRLNEHPDNNLQRLKAVRSVDRPLLGDIRIFDTPGYGSIVKEHEEVLKDFLPNSDIVVYTVNYKIGIQDEDYIFLHTLRELIRQDVKIFLVVNRCPVGVDRKSEKVRNIAQYVSGILNVTPEVFTVENVPTRENEEHPIPRCEGLWESVSQTLAAPERMETLNAAFDGYIKDLYNRCLETIEARYAAAKLSADEFDAVIRLQEEESHRIKSAVREYVVPTFEKIEKALPKKIWEVKERVKYKIHEEIEKSSTTDKEEMVSYVNAHLLPYTIMDETAEIQRYIELELDDLNRKVDDYIQKELVRFNNQLSVTINSNVNAAISTLTASIIKNAGRDSLQTYFLAFGGNGGANAGIANAASHLLKKAGDAVGHTFSRATHNGMKHMLSKVGATSMKAVGAAVAVVTELLFIAYDLATWKGKLRNKVDKGLDKWQDETYTIVKQDLAKLREENISTIRQIADETFAKAFDTEKPQDMEQCRRDYLYAQNIGKQIEIE